MKTTTNKKHYESKLIINNDLKQVRKKKNAIQNYTKNY